MFAGLVMGLLTGDLALALSISVFFELVWLDLFPAGTYIHPNALSSVFLSVFLCQAFNLTTPSEAIIPLLLGGLSGEINARLESLHRIRNNKAFTRLIKWARSRHADDAATPGRLIINAISIIFAVNFVYFLCIEILGIGIIRLLRLLLEQADLGSYIIVPGMEWGHFWMAGLLGAILAIRYNRGYIVMALATLLTAVFILG